MLWEQRLDDAIPPDHPVRQVEYLPSSRAFAETFREWERYYVLVERKPPYHPHALAGLYIYGMLNGIRSSRQLEATCYNRLDVIWLMQGQHPDHSTIAEFVKTHGRHLKSVFRDVAQVARRAGLIRLGHVAVDGTKIEANAGKKSVHKEQSLADELAGLDEQIATLEGCCRRGCQCRGGAWTRATGFQPRGRPVVISSGGSFQQYGKAGLLEVMIRGQGLGQPFLFHDNERDAVRQRPALVPAVSIVLDSHGE